MPRAETIIDNRRGLGYYGTIMSTAAEITTADQLLREPSLGRCELVRENFPMSPSGSLHAIIAAKMAGLLWEFVEPRKLGWVFGAEGGFGSGTTPTRSRAPDVAFVECRPDACHDSRGLFPRPARSGRRGALAPQPGLRSVGQGLDWLETGCPLVWVVDPENRSVTVYGRQKRDAYSAPFPTCSTGGDILPGLAGRASEDFSRHDGWSTP